MLGWGLNSCSWTQGSCFLVCPYPAFQHCMDNNCFKLHVHLGGYPQKRIWALDPKWVEVPQLHRGRVGVQTRFGPQPVLLVSSRWSFTQCLDYGILLFLNTKFFPLTAQGAEMSKLVSLQMADAQFLGILTPKVGSTSEVHLDLIQTPQLDVCVLWFSLGNHSQG